MFSSILDLIHFAVLFFAWDVFIPFAVYWPDMTPMLAGKIPFDAVWALVMYLMRWKKVERRNDRS